ncbi:hypothetical protein GCM10010315_44740 [Streptomyces luteosporeus]|uniref:HAMP domain-containing protein n=1 Tax=Streptomyces luteosporeus TaxID=173856 RepID=A0ABN3TZM1_9ACTN
MRVALPALLLIHVVRPLRRVAGLVRTGVRALRAGTLRIEVLRMRPGRLLRDGRGAHSPR